MCLTSTTVFRQWVVASKSCPTGNHCPVAWKTELSYHPQSSCWPCTTPTSGARQPAPRPDRHMWYQFLPANSANAWQNTFITPRAFRLSKGQLSLPPHLPTVTTAAQCITRQFTSSSTADCLQEGSFKEAFLLWQCPTKSMETLKQISRSTAFIYLFSLKFYSDD